MVPFENSTNGQVVFTYDLIRDWYLNKDSGKRGPGCQLTSSLTPPTSSDPAFTKGNPSFRVVGEQYVHIHHNLITRATSLQDIKVIYSHPQVWTQVTRFLKKIPPQVVREDKSSTSEAAAWVEKDLSHTSACISSTMSARLYNLPIMEEGVEDNQNNTTRFLVLGYHAPPILWSPPEYKPLYLTSLLFTLNSNDPGALCQALTTFMNRGVDLISINSRPSHLAQWQYVFFVETLSTKPNDQEVLECAVDLEKMCSSVVVLGQFVRCWRYNST